MHYYASMSLRILQKSDLPQVLTIENAVHITPWTKETFAVCLESPCVGVVLEIEARVIGFALASVRIGECHILNIGVLHAHQRQGYGEMLLKELLVKAKEQGAGIAYLEVRRTNTRAIALYQKLQFQQIGERKNYYPSGGGYEDALILAKTLVN